ncbi:hypothetical protein DXC26_17585 [Clostridiaceae bacterium OM08-6BH]|nr:hypothetical protein DXC26_17585 [Clostridiaceae bacterium OM08-6BH]
MKKIYFAQVDCSVSEAIKYALQGHCIVVPEQDENGKPSLELINFSEQEAKDFNAEISEGIGKRTRLVIRR